MPNDENRGLLESIPALSELGDDVLDRLSDVVSERSFEKGDVLLYEYDTTRDTYFILDGLCEVWGDKQKIGESGPGDIDGEIALLYRKPRSGTVKASTDVRALVLPADDFDKIAEADPSAATAIRSAIETYLHTRFAQ